MADSWLHSFIAHLADLRAQESPLSFLARRASCMLFQREGGVFSLLEKGSYADPDFRYAFLSQKPELLLPLLEKACGQLPAAEASRKDCSLWAAVDQIPEPLHLLLAELPSAVQDAGPLLRLLLNMELAFRGVRGRLERAPAAYAKVDLPVWLQDVLPALLEKKSPMLVIAEAGSGKEELVQAFLKAKYHSLDAAVFFHPGRLSQAVQLRELFGDPAGARLGGLSPGIPITHRREPVVVVQEAGDLDPLAQLRLLAFFTACQGEQKLWIFETSRDLRAMVRAERFLHALCELLWNNAITLPPLRACRERLTEEIDRLMSLFQECYRRAVSLSEEARQALSVYHWPGNWRELRNSLESAFLMAHDNNITKSDLRLGHWSAPEDWDDLNLRKHSEALERNLLLRAYALHAGNQVQMARALGISRGSLQYKLGKYRFN